MNPSDPQSSLWEVVKNDFRGAFPQDVFNTWFASMQCVRLEDSCLTLSVPNEFAAYWIEDNYGELITTRLHQASGSPLRYRLEVLASEPSSRLPETAQETLRAPAASTHAAEEDRAVAPPSREAFQINPKNTFANFVVGPSNEMAHASAMAVANAPARVYNPLFIYGDTGLGKTHLMHAVALQVTQNNPKAHVAYVTTEKFTNHFIRALQEGTLAKFRKNYRKADVLIIDDIHFLSGKERIQEEIFHTFNDLYESQKQIIIASDRPANEIAKLENRLVSRFGWGMVADIQPPDLETRQAILAKKALAANLKLDDELVYFLARRIPRNVRRMEGALTRIGAYLAINKGATLTQDRVENLLKDVLLEEAHEQLNIDKIQKRVADHYQLRLADMSSKRRPANIAFPRQIAMYLSRLLTNSSLQEIGGAFGGRDHGTVIHAIKTVENMMEQDESVRRSVEYLKKHLTDQR